VPADELQPRWDAFGTAYVAINAAFTEQFAPVVDCSRAAGRPPFR